MQTIAFTLMLKLNHKFVDKTVWRDGCWIANPDEQPTEATKEGVNDE